MGFDGIYPLVNVYKALWKDPPFFPDYFDWAMLNSYGNKLPEVPLISHMISYVLQNAS